MRSINAIMKWNAVDTIIFSIEKLISKVADEVKEAKDELPVPEEMIAAATKELKEENEELRQYRIPGYLIEHDRAYECPACGREISPEEIEGLKSKTVKYCNNCGKRIILSKISSYAKTYANNLVEKHE